MIIWFGRQLCPCAPAVFSGGMSRPECSWTASCTVPLDDGTSGSLECSSRFLQTYEQTEACRSPAHPSLTPADLHTDNERTGREIGMLKQQIFWIDMKTFGISHILHSLLYQHILFPITLTKLYNCTKNHGHDSKRLDGPKNFKI